MKRALTFHEDLTLECQLILDERSDKRPRRAITIVQAVLRVMQERGRALSPAEAFAEIVERKLYRFATDDPVSVVRSAIRRRCEGIEFASAASEKIFRATNDGRYEPSPRRERPPVSDLPVEPSLIGQIEALQAEHDRHVRARILNALLDLTPDAFERFAERLLRAYGFNDVQVTKKSRDGGIDGHGRLAIGLTTVSVAFQCKRYRKNTVGRETIDAFRGATSGLHEQGYLFTTSRFTKEAVEAQRRPGAVPIILFDGPKIVDIMFDRGFGVAFRELRVPELALDAVLEE